MTITVTVTEKDIANLPKITKEEVDKIRQNPPVFDDDSPKFSKEQLKEFKPVNPRNDKKQA